MQRIADLTLAPDGSVTGFVTIICTGQHAMRWRQRALEGDQVALKKEFDEELQSDLPPGIMVHTDTSSDSTARTQPAGSSERQRLARHRHRQARLPAPLHLRRRRPNPFTSSHREEPIDLRYPFLEKDKVILHLPDGIQVGERSLRCPRRSARKWPSILAMPRRRVDHHLRPQLHDGECLSTPPRSMTSSRASSTTSARRTGRRPSCSSRARTTVRPVMRTRTPSARLPSLSRR